MFDIDSDISILSHVACNNSTLVIFSTGFTFPSHVCPNVDYVPNNDSTHTKVTVVHASSTTWPFYR